MAAITERRVHQIFEVTVVLKGAHALVECLGGLFLALIGTDSIVRLVAWATQQEIAEDPNDFVASHLLAWSQSFSISTKQFFAFYLLSHGVIKLVLVVGLLRNQVWAYPASLVVLGLFILYQVYRFTLTGSPFLVALTMLDLVVLALVWHEYTLIRRHLPRA
ncbi:MAG: DUF2127 domain-containing protein [Bauldia sp.]